MKNEEPVFREILIADFFIRGGQYFILWHLRDVHPVTVHHLYGTATIFYHLRRHGMEIEREVRVRVQSDILNYEVILDSLRTYNLGIYLKADFWRRPTPRVRGLNCIRTTQES